MQTSNSFCPAANALAITEIRETATALNTLFESGEPVTIDLSETHEIDASGLQLLIAAQRSAERHKTQLSILADEGGALEQVLVRVGFLDADGKPRNAQEQAWADILKKGTQPA